MAIGVMHERHKHKQGNDVIGAIVATAFSKGAGWVVTDRSKTGGQVQRESPSPEHVRWEIVDVRDRNRQRAAAAGLGRLLLAPTAIPRLARVLLIPDTPLWRLEGSELLLQVPRDLGVRVVAFRRGGRSIRLSELSKWGHMWPFGSSVERCPS
jgi:hypothetical protein